jgi:hypothetical protein
MITSPDCLHTPAMFNATVIYRFITDLNPIQAEWIVLRASSSQCDPDASVISHLQNPLCGTAMPANGRLDEPSTLSLELERGRPELTVHGLGDNQEAMLLIIGFGGTDIRDQFVSAESAREL